MLYLADFWLIQDFWAFSSSPLVEVAQRLLPSWECEQKATICWTAGKGRNGAVSSLQADAHWRGKAGCEDGGEGELPVQLDTRTVVKWEINV